MKKAKATKKKAARKTKVSTRAKTAKPRKVTARKVRPAAKKKKRAVRPVVKEIRSPETSTLGGETFSAEETEMSIRRSRAAGQSGDVQGLSRRALVDSESVEELIEEGQAREAAAISGVEDAPDPDEAEVRTRQVPEDDVPEEYTDEG